MRPPIGAAEFPIYHEVRQEAHGGMLPKAILEGDPYPVRGMIVSGASILTAWPDPALWRRALAALDLLVVIDRFPTGDAAYADLVLPATTMFEIESYQEFDDRVELRQRILPPPGEARNDYLIFAELADRLGYGERWPQTERGMVELALRDTGITYDELAASPDGIELPQPEQRYRKYETGELRADGAPGLQHADGQARDHVGVVPQLRLRAAAGVHRADRRAAGRAGPGEALPAGAQLGCADEERFPLAAPQHPVARRHAAGPLVHLHADDAAARGIADGDEVDVVTPRGSVRFRARVSTDIVRGAVEANMGGGGPLGPEAWRRANVNDLTDPDNYDPISGFPVYKALLCEVVPAPAVVSAMLAGLDPYQRLYAHRTGSFRSSAMRDLMAITSRPEVISLAGGLPDTTAFPPDLLSELVRT